jgi:hypothetical protein
MKYMEEHPLFVLIVRWKLGSSGFKMGRGKPSYSSCFMVMIAAITASLKMHHIGLRPARTKLDHKVYSLR